MSMFMCRTLNSDMDVVFKMGVWSSCNFQRSIAFFFPLATYIFKTDGAYILSCNNDGVFTSVFDNGSWGCIPCTKCPIGFRTIRPCRYNSDTTCEKCPPETYVTESGENCRPCSRCSPGYYVEKHCHGNQDRDCKVCAQGYYSRYWNSLSCRRCKRCKPKENVVEPCTGRNNSVCGECDKEYYRESSTWECMPCSKCEGEDYVRVKECIRKLGEHSQFICQLQAFIFRDNESQTTAVESSKMIDPRISLVDATTVTIPALLVVVCCVLLLFIIAVIYRRCLHNFPSRLLRSCRTDTQMISSYADVEMTGDIGQYLVSNNTDREKTPLNQTSWRAISVSSEQRSMSKSDASYQTEDTASLLNYKENPSPRVHRKKKKRRLRTEHWQSDSDIVTENRYAVLDAAKFTTI